MTCVELALDVLGIARHGETEDPVDQRQREVAGVAGLGAGPFGIVEARLHDAEQIEDADDRDEARVLEQADEVVDDAGNDDLQRLRHDDQAHHLPVGQANRHATLHTGPSGSPADHRE